MKSLFLVSSLLLTTSSFANSKACFSVEGMTCATCSVTLKAAVKKLDGIGKVYASVKNSEAVVNFNPAITSKQKILKQINSTGYKASAKQCKKRKG